MNLQMRATLTATVTALFLIAIKLTVGFLTGTVVIIASAIDSMLDFVVSLFNYFAAKKSAEPMDESFNYGRGKIEGLASVFEGLIITFSGLFIIYEAWLKMMSGEKTELLGYSLAVMTVSMTITFALVGFLNRVYKQTGSLVIKSDALHYKTDLFSNAGIIASLLAIYLTGLDIIDPLVSVGIAIYIIYSASGIVKEGVEMLLDKALDKEIVEKIETTIERFINEHSELLKSYHELKTRQSGHFKFVDVHLVFSENAMLKEAHNLSDRVEGAVRALGHNNEWIINIHQDYHDDRLVKDRV